MHGPTTWKADDYDLIESIVHSVDSHYRDEPDIDALAAGAGISREEFEALFQRWSRGTAGEFLDFVRRHHTRHLLKYMWEEDNDNPFLSEMLQIDVDVTVDVLKRGRQRAGDGLRLRFGYFPSPFGEYLLGVVDEGICGLHFIDNSRGESIAEMYRQWPGAEFMEDQSGTMHYAASIFGSERYGRKPKLFMRGTRLQTDTWLALQRIPFASAVSYLDIAEEVGDPTALRSIIAAVAANPIAYLIPCHRAIRDTGQFGSYPWGVLRKRIILALEATFISSL